jgi:hypothetical protein
VSWAYKWFWYSGTGNNTPFGAFGKQEHLLQ